MRPHFYIISSFNSRHHFIRSCFNIYYHAPIIGTSMGWFFPSVISPLTRVQKDQIDEGFRAMNPFTLKFKNVDFYNAWILDANNTMKGVSKFSSVLHVLMALALVPYNWWSPSSITPRVILFIKFLSLGVLHYLELHLLIYYSLQEFLSFSSQYTY